MSPLRRRSSRTTRFSIDGGFVIPVSGIQFASQRHRSHTATDHNPMMITAAM
jgi:hypothetical protein